MIFKIKTHGRNAFYCKYCGVIFYSPEKDSLYGSNCLCGSDCPFCKRKNSIRFLLKGSHPNFLREEDIDESE